MKFINVPCFGAYFQRIRHAFVCRLRKEPVPVVGGLPVCWNWLFQRQMLFLVGGSMLKWRRNARCTAVADSDLMNSLTQQNLVLHSSHFALNWRCALGERCSGGIWNFRTSSFKYYVHHPHMMYSSGNIVVRNCVHIFESPCIYTYCIWPAR
jgi:hypothetical protein